MPAQLFLRTTNADGKSYGGFQWPMEVGATVTAPDWDPAPECGGGLHGLLNGEGSGILLSYDDATLWWIVEAEDAVDLGGKHKFPKCKVVMFGHRRDVAKEMKARTGGAVHGLEDSVGDRSTLTGGDYSSLTGGNYSTLTGGYRSSLTGGDRSTLTGGYRSTLTGGDYSSLTGGDRSTLTGGYRSTLIFLSWRRGYRRALVAYVGDDGIEPGIAYRANDDSTKVIRAE